VRRAPAIRVARAAAADSVAPLSRNASIAPPRNSTATTASTRRCGRTANSVAPTVTAIATWTVKARAAPAHTALGLPRVAISSDANIVLSGSSATKMIGKTAAAIARSIDQA
jgi:hypothetical protein